MKKEYLLFLVIPLSQLMIILGNASYEPFDALGYAGILLSLAADAVLIYVLRNGARKELLERELEGLRIQRETERMSMEMLEKRRRMLMAMQEELEARFRGINEDLEQGKTGRAEQELEALQDKLEDTRPAVWCQNRIVNAVLDEKGKAARELGTEWEVELLVPQKLQIEPFHLCSLFANLLDNALEAVEELPKPERFIRIHGETQGNYLLIKVENASTRVYAARRKREGRGTGTRILQKIAEEYDGTYTAGFRDGVYTASVVVKGV